MVEPGEGQADVGGRCRHARDVDQAHQGVGAAAVREGKRAPGTESPEAILVAVEGGVGLVGNTVEVEVLAQAKGDVDVVLDLVEVDVEHATGRELVEEQRHFGRIDDAVAVEVGDRLGGIEVDHAQGRERGRQVVGVTRAVVVEIEVEAPQGVEEVDEFLLFGGVDRLEGQSREVAFAAVEVDHLADRRIEAECGDVDAAVVHQQFTFTQSPERGGADLVPVGLDGSVGAVDDDAVAASGGDGAGLVDIDHLVQQEVGVRANGDVAKRIFDHLVRGDVAGHVAEGAAEQTEGVLARGSAARALRWTGHVALESGDGLHEESVHRHLGVHARGLVLAVRCDTGLQCGLVRAVLAGDVLVGQSQFVP